MRGMIARLETSRFDIWRSTKVYCGRKGIHRNRPHSRPSFDYRHRYGIGGGHHRTLIGQKGIPMAQVSLFLIESGRIPDFC